eukprot:403371786
MNNLIKSRKLLSANSTLQIRNIAFLQYTQQRLFVGRSDKFREREQGEERIYVDQKDREALKRLARKLSKQEQESPDFIETEKQRLQNIFKDHGVQKEQDQGLIKKLIDWKNKYD